MSRFDLDADRRAIEVARAHLVRITHDSHPGVDEHGDFYDLRCGRCGALLTLYEASRGLIYMHGWKWDGWTVSPHARRPRRARPHSRVVLSAGTPLATAFLPVTEKNHWLRLELPVVWACYRCREKSGLGQLPGRGIESPPET